LHDVVVLDIWHKGQSWIDCNCWLVCKDPFLLDHLLQNMALMQITFLFFIVLVSFFLIVQMYSIILSFKVVVRELQGREDMMPHQHNLIHPKEFNITVWNETEEEVLNLPLKAFLKDDYIWSLSHKPSLKLNAIDTLEVNKTKEFVQSRLIRDAFVIESSSQNESADMSKWDSLNQSISAVQMDFHGSSVEHDVPLQKVVGLYGVHKFYLFMKRLLNGKHLFCNKFKESESGLLNIQFGCNDLFTQKGQGLGTGNMIAGLYTIRLAAKVKKIHVNITCHDAEQEKVNLITPWLALLHGLLASFWPHSKN